MLAFRQGGEDWARARVLCWRSCCFRLGVGPEAEILRRVGAGIVWVAALLAAVLSLDRLFAADYADGGLDLLALSAMPLEGAVVANARRIG